MVNAELAAVYTCPICHTPKDLQPGPAPCSQCNSQAQSTLLAENKESHSSSSSTASQAGFMNTTPPIEDRFDPTAIPEDVNELDLGNDDILPYSSPNTAPESDIPLEEYIEAAMDMERSTDKELDDME